jgi:hypothetical protein
MLHHIYLTIINIFHHWVSSILFIIALYFSVLILIFCMNDLSFAREDLNMYDEMMEKNIIIFRPFYPIHGTIDMSKITHSLQDHMDNLGDAFSVISSMHVESYPDIPVIIGIGSYGQAFNLIPDGLKNNGDDYTVLIGSNIQKLNIGSTLYLSGQKYEVNGRLKPGSFGLHYQNSISLDDSIVILSTFNNFTKNEIYPTYIEELLTRVGFIGASDEEIEAFAQLMGEGGYITLIPENVNTYIAPKRIQYYRISLLISIFIFIIAFFICIGMLCTLLIMIDRNIREFTIHRLYGCRLSYLYIHIILYVSCITIPPVVYAILISRYHYKSSWVIAVILIVLYIALTSIIPIIRLKKQEISYFIRRDIS